MPPATASRIRDSVTISSRGSDTPAGTATFAAGGRAAAGRRGRGAAGGGGVAAGASVVGAAAWPGPFRRPPGGSGRRRRSRRWRRHPGNSPPPSRRTSGDNITPAVRAAARTRSANRCRHHWPTRRQRRPQRRVSMPPCAGAVVPASPIRASGVPTGTVSPAATRISSSTPSYGLGISESTLSVDTSNSGSSNSTVSPAFFSQELMVPSVTVSPSFGMVMSCTMSAGAPRPVTSSDGPSEPPICGAAGSPSAGPPAAARWCVADGSRSAMGASRTTPPGGTIRTNCVPTGTVSPALTRISAITPS